MLASDAQVNSDQLSVSVFVKPRFSDLYWATVFTMVRQFRAFLTIFALMAALAGLILLWAVASRHPLPSDTKQSIEGLRVLFPRFLAGICFFLFGVPLLSTRKILNRSEIKRGVSYVFSGMGLQVDSSVGHSEIKWLMFRKAHETRWAFLLSSTAGTTYTFPKHCFEANSDFPVLRQILRTALPESNLRDS
jgi:hypothetical protein